MLDVNITMDAAAVTALMKRVDGLAGGNRTEAHGFMAPHVENFTRDYLLGIGGTRHKTAAGLGAQPTGFLTSAAGTVQAAGTPQGVALGMQRAGLSRAFYTYVIRPSKLLLTIPVAAEAYGKRAREFPGLKWRKFSAEDVAEGKSDRAGLVLGRQPIEPGGLFHALFAGARKTTIKQDRSLLPSDQDWFGCIEDGVDDYLAAKAESTSPAKA